MPIFITQGRYSRDAIKGMLAKPEDRLEAAAKLAHPFEDTINGDDDIFQTTSAYTDASNTYDPGGRLGQLMFRINW